jgi:hypothetical protein
VRTPRKLASMRHYYCQLLLAYNQDFATMVHARGKELAKCQCDAIPR